MGNTSDPYVFIYCYVTVKIREKNQPGEKKKIKKNIEFPLRLFTQSSIRH